jgi:hypothetical protein
VEDLTGLCPMIFSFALESFPRKNHGILLVGCFIIFHCIVSEFILVLVDYLISQKKKKKKGRLIPLHVP